jgi:formaldehyde-activating enzyme involved in methanogenesis
MRRRIFLAGLICSCVVRSASVQHSGKIWRVAYLNPGVATAGGSSIYRDWLQRIGELGYVEGENLVVDLRYAEGDYSRLPQLVHELIELKPDAMLAIATPAIAAAQRATTTIPIIMGPATDPVGSGFIKSLSRPGGNITGLANMSGDYTSKTVELLRELLPQARRIAVLMSSNSTHPMQYSLAETAAHNLGLEIVPVTAAKEEDLDQAFQTVARAQCDALLVLNDPVRPRFTGASVDAGPSIHGKRIALLREMFPAISKLGCLALRFQDDALVTGVAPIPAAAEAAGLPIAVCLYWKLVPKTQTGGRRSQASPVTVQMRSWSSIRLRPFKTGL